MFYHAKFYVLIIMSISVNCTSSGALSDICALANVQLLLSTDETKLKFICTLNAQLYNCQPSNIVILLIHL